MLNQDKVLRNFNIALIVIVLALIASGWYHSGKNIAPTKTQTVESAEAMKDVAKSGGL
jgi:hypothetical protein